MGRVFEDAKKIGQVIDERKKEGEKQQARWEMNGGERECQKEDWDQDHLKRLDERDVSDIEKIEADGIDDYDEGRAQACFSSSFKHGRKRSFLLCLRRPFELLAIVRL